MADASRRISLSRLGDEDRLVLDRLRVFAMRGSLGGGLETFFLAFLKTPLMILILQLP